MSAVLEILQSLIGDPPTMPVKGTQAAWEFSKELLNKDFNALVLEHSMLHTVYSVTCTRLIIDINRKRPRTESLSEQDRISLTTQLIRALRLAETLAHVYCYHLNVSREVIQLEKEQQFYRKYLAEQGFEFHEIPVYGMKPSLSPSQKIRQTHADFNFTRLFAIRIRRVLITLVPLLQVYERYCRFVAYFDRFAAPFFTYLSWVFFSPRLATNLFLLFKHLFPWFFPHKKQEVELTLFTRLVGQLQRRWFELGNDAAWFLSGILACFVLTGALSPAAMYFTIGVFFFDVVWAGLRAVIELNRIKKILDAYDEMAKGLEGDELSDWREQQKFLTQRFEFEQKRMLLSVISTTAIFLAMCFAIPAIGVNPIVPFVGAVLVLMITAATFVVSRNLDKQRPCDRISDQTARRAKAVFYSPLVMFKPAESPIEHVIDENNNVFRY